MILDVTVNGRDYRVELEREEKGGWHCRVNGEAVIVDATNTAKGVLSLIADGQSYQVISNPAQQQIAIAGTRYAVEVRDPRSWSARRSKAVAGDGPKKVLASMPGKVVRLIAREGTDVEQGAGVIVIEAMKMQNELKSPKTGRVSKILVREGTAVNAGDVLAIVE